MSFDAQHGERLREERERLGLSQQQAADAVQIRREMWSKYERGLVSPGADVFIGMTGLRIDVMYVLTGVRHGSVLETNQLSPREAALLDNYRHSGEEGKRAVEVAAAALAKPKAVGD